jgi:hypothetical protein
LSKWKKTHEMHDACGKILEKALAQEGASPTHVLGGRRSASPK